MKHDFENGTSYPMIAGELNGGNVINRQFVFGTTDGFDDLDFSCCGIFDEAPEVIKEEVLGNIDDDLAADVRGGRFYAYEECENITYIFDWD
jgi:hypothetical protein